MERQRRVNPIADNQHETRLLITHDSPHRGANVPLGLQCMIQSLGNLSLTVLGGSTGLSYISLRELIPPIAQYDRFVNNPANTQLAIYRAQQPFGSNQFTFSTNTFLDNQYRNMITFPANAPPPYKLVMSSNGSECGGATQISNIINVDASIFVSPFTRFISQTKWRTEVQVNALPTAGQSETIYHGKIWSEYRLLGVIFFNAVLWEQQVFNPPYTLPLDGASGGTFPITNSRRGVNSGRGLDLWIFGYELNQIVAPRFCFVPTYSALDVTDAFNNQTISKPFYGGMPNPTSRAANIIGATRVDIFPEESLFSETHIQFTNRNTNWMFNEMENINAPNLNNCVYRCTPAQMVGVNGVCADWNTFSISPAPSSGGVNINWWTSPPGSLIIESPNSPTTRIKTAPNISTNNVLLFADITDACGNLPLLSRSLLVGVPNIVVTVNNQSYQTPTRLCVPKTYVLRASDGSNETSYTWRLDSPNPNVQMNPNGAMCDIYATQPTAFTVIVSKPNSCGIQETRLPFQVINDCSQASIQIFPNPTPTVVTVSFDNLDNVYSVQIIDKFGIVQKEMTEAALKSSSLLEGHKKEVRFDLSNLERGVYYLHIITNQGTQKHQIVKE